MRLFFVVRIGSDCYRDLWIFNNKLTDIPFNDLNLPNLITLFCNIDMQHFYIDNFQDNTHKTDENYY